MNLPANYIALQSKILKSITADEIKRNSNKYIQPQKLKILPVGDNAKIADNVEKSGYEIVKLNADGKPVEVKKAF